MSRDRANPSRRRSTRPRLEALEGRIPLTTLPAGFAESVVAGNLGTPTSMDVAPDGRVFITTQAGDLRVVKDGAPLPTPFLHLNVDSGGERGLLGVALDPNFAANHFVYVYHTVPAAGGAAPFNEVSRFTAVGDVAAPGSEVDILKLNDLSGATNHNGGPLHFGRDGLLYIGVGENANPANSQTLGTLLGKVLRIDVAQVQPGDGLNDVAKLVPPGNPFVGVATGINQAIYALGFRNPFTFAVQPGTGTIFINDVGQSTWEEIDRLVPGGNYGWNRSEGFANPSPPAGLGPGVYQDPQLAYNHQGGPAGGGSAIVGGTFYDPPAGAADPFPSAYTGKYFYQDLGGDWIRVFDPAHPGSLATPDTSSGFATGTVASPVDLAVAPDGGLYQLVIGNGGELLKISSTATQSPAITLQPAGLTVAEGAPATFGVAAGGPGTLIYQWQRSDGGGGFVNIAGATSPTFTLADARLSDNQAQFRVIVANANGAVASDAATLGVVASRASAVAGDYDGDGKADLGIYDATTSTFIVVPSGGGQPLIQPFGDPSHHNIPVVGDYDGDRKTDVAIFDATTSTFLALPSGGGSPLVRQFGDPSHVNIPVAGDYDGDHRTDLGIYDATTSTLLVIPSGGGRPLVQPFGDPSHRNIPVVGDYYGTGQADLGIFDATTSTFIVAPPAGSTGLHPLIRQFGDPSHANLPVLGDYDGDHKTDLGIYDATTSTLLVIPSGGGLLIQPFGDPSHANLPVVGDYYGTGRADVGIFDATTSTLIVAPPAGSAGLRPLVRQFGDPSHRNLPLAVAVPRTAGASAV